MAERTATEKVYDELKDFLKDEPNKNMILGYTMGVIEKNKPNMINEFLETMRKQNKPS